MLDQHLNFLKAKLKEGELKPFQLFLVSICAWSCVTKDNPLAINIRRKLGLELVEDFEEAYNILIEKIEKDPTLLDKLKDFFFLALEREGFRKNLIQLYLSGFKDEIISVLEEARKIKTTTYIEELLRFFEKEAIPFAGIEKKKEKVFTISSILVGKPIKKVLEKLRVEELMEISDPAEFYIASKTFKFNLDTSKVDVKVSIKAIPDVQKGIYKEFIATSYTLIYVLAEEDPNFFKDLYEISKIIELSGRTIFDIIFISTIPESPTKIDFRNISNRIRFLIRLLDNLDDLEDVLKQLFKILVKREMLSTVKT